MKGKRDYEVGKNKPPVHSRIKPGEARNPGGKTSEQRKLEISNAELALQAQNRMLRALVAFQSEKSTEEILAGMSATDLLRLMKDAMDRGFGTPKATVDVTQRGDPSSPEMQAAIIAALRAKHGTDRG